MFLFRWISNILAPIGIILALIIVFFALNPLKVTPQPGVELGTVLSCTPKNINPSNAYLNDQEMLKLKNELGAGIPIELVNEFAFGNVSNSLFKAMGTKADLHISYCTVPDDSSVVVTNVQKYFDNQKKYYTYGTLEDFVNKINSLPFAKISNFDLKVPSTFIRSTYCNQPINHSDFYLFSIVPGTQNNNVVVIFNMSFIDDEKAEQKNVYTRNLIETGQYIKSKFYCNG